MKTGVSAPEFPLFSIIISLEHIDSTMVLQTEPIMNQNDLIAKLPHGVLAHDGSNAVFCFLIDLSADQPDFYVLHH